MAMSKRDLINALLEAGNLDDQVILVNTNVLHASSEDTQPFDIGIDIHGIENDTESQMTYLYFAEDTAAVKEDDEEFESL